jgi:hypothetical protein
VLLPAVAESHYVSKLMYSFSRGAPPKQWLVRTFSVPVRVEPGNREDRHSIVAGRFAKYEIEVGDKQINCSDAESNSSWIAPELRKLVEE